MEVWQFFPLGPGGGTVDSRVVPILCFCSTEDEAQPGSNTDVDQDYKTTDDPGGIGEQTTCLRTNTCPRQFNPLIEDTANEVEEIPAQLRSRPEVYAFRIDLYTAAQKWGLLEAVSLYLVKSEPDWARWWLVHATATYHMKGVWEAERVLVTALAQHEHERDIRFALARI